MDGDGGGGSSKTGCLAFECFKFIRSFAGDVVKCSIVDFSVVDSPQCCPNITIGLSLYENSVGDAIWNAFIDITSKRMGTPCIGFVDYSVMCIVTMYLDFVGSSLVFAAALSGYGIGIRISDYVLVATLSTSP